MIIFMPLQGSEAINSPILTALRDFIKGPGMHLSCLLLSPGMEILLLFLWLKSKAKGSVFVIKYFCVMLRKSSVGG
jgi:hypothetical protein